MLQTFLVYGQEMDFDCIQATDHIRITPDTVAREVSFIDKNKHIGSIANSRTDFEIRYYFTPSLVNGGQVTIISCSEGKITARKIDYWFNLKKDYEKRKISKTKTTQLEPVGTWKEFFDTLEVVNFYYIPTMDLVRPKMKKYMTLDDGRVVEKRSMITDGANYTFEMKKGSAIRTFSYHSPEAWYKVYDNVDELKQVSELINIFKVYLHEGNSH